MANMNGWIKPVLVGVAVFVLGAVIVGVGSNTYSNTIERSKLEVRVDASEKEIEARAAAIHEIPVMAVRIENIQEDVGDNKDILKEILTEIRKK